MSPSQFDVWLEVGRDGRCFTYQDGLKLGVQLGDIVLVRLRGRTLRGLVVEKCLSTQNNYQNIKAFDPESYCFADVEAVVEKSAVDQEWREWLEEMARKYYVSSFRMIKTALPNGWLGSSKHAVKISTKRRWWLELNMDFDMYSKLTQRQNDLRNKLLSSGGGIWQRELEKQGFSAGLIKSFVDNKYACRRKLEYKENVNSKDVTDKGSLIELESPQTLTNEQQAAIRKYVSMGDGCALLLWGVTGSGKTEVYLQVAAMELEAGRHCLVLTPEIGLVPQLVDRFKRRFGDNVMEYHSHCSNKEKVATWRRANQSTKSYVFIGTRSAVFLPLPGLGLIVLDEEHDSSYKQESPMPCYHARDMALTRAKRFGSKIIMGTATPSLNVWRTIKPKGSLILSRLTHRILHRKLPTVQVVDMREELASGHRCLISRHLKKELIALKESGSQAIILVPRRGYNSFLSCRSCGEVMQCPNCDVALTVHRSKQGQQWLRCHWCDFRSSVKNNCEQCGSSAFKPFGAGTQKVVDTLERELNGFRVLRFDKDTTSGRDGHRFLLERFASGEADVLVGTQMLAKGIDLPRVTLAVVLAADGLLHRPDLLAGEQTLQLFMQLAGRAGRGEKPGKVLLQTYCPDHPVVRYLIGDSYEGFLENEALLRQEARLVPFCSACLLRFAGESSEITAKAAGKLAEKIRGDCGLKSWSIIGPAPSLMSRVAGKSRWQLLLHGPETSALPLPYGPELWKDLPKGVTLSLDPDPMQL